MGSTYEVSEHGKKPYIKLIGKTRLLAIRRMLKCKPIPEFKTDRSLPWLIENVKIIPIGVRYDHDIIEPQGLFKGWTHEAL